MSRKQFVCGNILDSLVHISIPAAAAAIFPPQHVASVPLWNSRSVFTRIRSGNELDEVHDYIETHENQLRPRNPGRHLQPWIIAVTLRCAVSRTNILFREMTDKSLNLALVSYKSDDCEDRWRTRSSTRIHHQVLLLKRLYQHAFHCPFRRLRRPRCRCSSKLADRFRFNGVDDFVRLTTRSQIPCPA